MTTRNKVFVSYSHLDSKFLLEFKSMLHPLIGTHIDLWDDTMIRTGKLWRDELERALKSAKVGVLLVTDNFLKSDFIKKHELPPLLDAAQTAGVTIFWIAVTDCMTETTELDRYHAANDPKQPLANMTKQKRKGEWKKICLKLLEITKGAI